MKMQSTKLKHSRYCYDMMLYYYKYPEPDLTSRYLDAAYEKAFYARFAGDPEGYAQNTTAWD